MTLSQYLKKTALDSLFGNWGVSVRTGFVASLIGGTLANTTSNVDTDNINELLTTIKNTDLLRWLYFVIVSAFVVFVIYTIAVVFVCGPAKLGYAKFNLNLIDKKKASFSDLFSQFNRFGTGLGMVFIIAVYTFLWSLLFVIPGIIKSYSYSMTPYILAEHTDYSEKQAINKSKEIMDGNKWNLFCLDFSFIGWHLLIAIPSLALFPFATVSIVGFITFISVVFISGFVGTLFLRPYKEAARAAFYRYISTSSSEQQESYSQN